MNRPCLIGNHWRGARPRAAAVAVRRRRRASGSSSVVMRSRPSPRARSGRRRSRAWRASRRAAASSGRVCSGAAGSRASSAGTSAHCANSCGQRGRKWQPCGRVEQRRRQARDRRQALRPRPVDARDRAEQAPGVRVLRVVEDLVDRALLDDPPRVHHGDAVGDVGHDAEVVRHEHRCPRRSARAARLTAEDLRLDRHVQRGRRLVGDQHRGSHDSAIAIITRWRMPPENSCG